MKILSVGSLTGLSNTCLHRHWALKKASSDIDEINTKPTNVSLWYKVANKLFKYGLPIPLPDQLSVNRKIQNLILVAQTNPYDVVWIDKGLTIDAKTLEFIKKHSPRTKIVSYSPDNMAERHNQSQNYLSCLPLYDIHFTTKSYILDEMKKLGCRKIYYTNKHYEQTFHYPRILSQKEIDQFGGDVGFIGAWEAERGQSIAYLAQHGIKVRVFGDSKWEMYRGIKNLEIFPGLYSEDYPKALQAFKISLCFLRKMNGDLQTSRSMEIPACGGFMLAERTNEHLQLFEEGIEAEFFSTNQELLEKCIYFLSNECERQRIAKAGNRRCETSGYSNEESIKRMLNLTFTDERD